MRIPKDSGYPSDKFRLQFGVVCNRFELLRGKRYFRKAEFVGETQGRRALPGPPEVMAYPYQGDTLGRRLSAQLFRNPRFSRFELCIHSFPLVKAFYQCSHIHDMRLGSGGANFLLAYFCRS
jgi:hypothetical protein